MIIGIFPFGCVWCVSQIWGPKTIIFRKKSDSTPNLPIVSASSIFKAGIWLWNPELQHFLGRHRRQGGPATCGDFYGLGSVSFEARSRSCHLADEDCSSSSSYPYYIDHLWSNRQKTKTKELKQFQKLHAWHVKFLCSTKDLICMPVARKASCIKNALQGTCPLPLGAGKTSSEYKHWCLWGIIGVFGVSFFTLLSLLSFQSPGLRIVPSPLYKTAGAFVD